MSQALYRKWRPSRWEQVVGQAHVIQTLRNAVAAEHVAHAYLFAGPRGTGKTTVARILAKAVNCTHKDLKERPDDQCEHCLAVNAGRFLDLIEIDAASNTSVEHVRDLRDKINFSPNQGHYKIYIIDEVHMLSTAAFNALLKTLEEPPPHAIFVLATTEIHKIPATVLSRCQRHEFRRIPVTDMIPHLNMLAKDEKIKIDEQALDLVARQATGSLRDAISLLDQLASMGEKITLEIAQTVLGTATSQAVLDVIDAVQEKDSAAGLNHIHRTLDGGSDPRQFARQIVNYLRDVMLVRMGSADQVDTTKEAREHMARHSQAFDAAELLRVIKYFNQAATQNRGVWQPSLPLELAFVEAIESPGEVLLSKPINPDPQTGTTKAVKKPIVKPGEPTKAKKKMPTRQSGGTGENKAITNNWPTIIKLLKEKSPNTAGLINSCKAREFRGGVLHLGFASDVLREKMEKEDNLALVEHAASEAFGKSVKVSCFLTTS